MHIKNIFQEYRKHDTGDGFVFLELGPKAKEQLDRTSVPAKRSVPATALETMAMLTGLPIMPVPDMDPPDGWRLIKMMNRTLLMHQQNIDQVRVVLEQGTGIEV